MPETRARMPEPLARARPIKQLDHEQASTGTGLRPSMALASGDRPFEWGDTSSGEAAHRFGDHVTFWDSLGSKPQDVIGWLTRKAGRGQLMVESSPATARADSPPSSPPCEPTGGGEEESSQASQASIPHTPPVPYSPVASSKALPAGAVAATRLSDSGTNLVRYADGAKCESRSSEEPDSDCDSPSPTTSSEYPLGFCTECKVPIAGAVFMLQDRPYCCQRHRLSAYSSKGGRDHSSAGPAPVSQAQGLLATYRTWI
jgi:hypothetical protein